MVLRHLTCQIHKLFNEITHKKTPPLEVIKYVENILIKSDFDRKIVDEIIARIKMSLRNYQSYSNVVAGLKNNLYKILYDVLRNKKPINYNREFFFFVGLQGSGKTTSIVKFASFLRKRHKRVLVVCLDTYRAGAYDQLRQNAQRLNIDFMGDNTEFDPVIIMKKAMKYSASYDHILFDTSGRNHQDTDLILELRQIICRCNNKSIILICDGNHTSAIEKHIKSYGDIDFCIVTKLDICDGGGPISVCKKLKIPISHISMGEHLHNFHKYNPSEIARKIIGIKMRQGKFSDFVDRNLLNRLQNDKYTLRDYKFQCEQFMENIHIFGGLMPPHMGKTIKSHLVIMKSMTAHELDMHEYLKLFKISLGNKRKKTTINSRIKRVAIGSGMHVDNIVTFFRMNKKFEALFGRLNFEKTMKNMNKMFQKMNNKNELFTEKKKI